MNEYKVGDKVWSISFPIRVAHYIEYKEGDKYWVGQNCPVYHFNNLFDSELDAVNDLIEKLETVRGKLLQEKLGLNDE